MEGHLIANLSNQIKQRNTHNRNIGNASIRRNLLIPETREDPLRKNDLLLSSIFI